MRLLFSSLLSFAVTAPALAQEPIKAVASFTILGDLVAQVCGDHCDVTTIVGPDADAHIYEPSMGDAIAVAEADIVFVNAWVLRLGQRRSSRTVAPVLKPSMSMSTAMRCMWKARLIRMLGTIQPTPSR